MSAAASAMSEPNVQPMRECLRDTFKGLTELDQGLHAFMNGSLRRLMILDAAEDPEIAADITRLQAGEIDLTAAIEAKSILAEVRASVLAEA